MKKLSAMASLLSLAFALALPALGADLQPLLKEAPESSTVLIAADIEQVLSLPFIKDMRKESPDLDKSYKELEGKLAAQSLTIEQLVTGFVVFANEGGDFNGLLIGTKLTEEKLESLLKGEIFGAPSSSYTVETISGHKTYVVKGAKAPLLSDAGMIPGMDALDDGGKPIALTFLAPGALLAIDKTDLDTYFKAKKGLPAKLGSRKATLSPSAPVWGSIDVPHKGEAQQPQASPMAMMDKVSGVAFSLDFKGQSKEDIAIKLCLECQDKAAATFTASQLQQMIFALSLTASQKNPQLSGELMNAIALNTVEQNVMIDISLPKKLIESLKNSMKPQTEEPEPAPAMSGAPAPAPGAAAN